VWAHVGVAQGHLLLGAVEEAEPALRRAEATDSPLAASAATRARTWAWLDAARGDLAAARRRLDGVAAELEAAGILVFEAAIRHDLVRFGDPQAALPRLEVLTAMVEGPLVQAMTDHAAGLVAGDADLLEASLAGFEQIGSLVLAAETAADLAALERRAGRSRRAAAAARRRAELVARTGGAATPPLRRGDGAEPLTRREHEVALLAAGGLTSKDIAERLYLSTRTVDTHLARVYRKLGVEGRTELGEALGGPGRVASAMNPGDPAGAGGPAAT
jgi:DNA-binding CsgD family transcriptional regulator